jgi:hypothetical protein
MLTYLVILCFSIFIGYSNGQSVCPDPDALLPCVCKVTDKTVVDIDCSQVRFSDELADIFKRVGSLTQLIANFIYA